MAHITGGGHPRQPLARAARRASARRSTWRRGSGRRCSTGWRRSAWSEDEMRRVFNLRPRLRRRRPRRRRPRTAIAACEGAGCDGVAGRRDRSRRGRRGAWSAERRVRSGCSSRATGTNLQALIDARRDDRRRVRRLEPAGGAARSSAPRRAGIDAAASRWPRTGRSDAATPRWPTGWTSAASSWSSAPATCASSPPAFSTAFRPRHQRPPLAAARVPGRARGRGRAGRRRRDDRRDGASGRRQGVDTGPVVAAGAVYPSTYDDIRADLRSRIHAVGAPAAARGCREIVARSGPVDSTTCAREART